MHIRRIIYFNVSKHWRKKQIFFCHFMAVILVPLRSTPTWHVHSKNSINLGETVLQVMSDYIPDSWFKSLNGYDIYV